MCFLQAHKFFPIRHGGSVDINSGQDILGEIKPKQTRPEGWQVARPLVGDDESTHKLKEQYLCVRCNGTHLMTCHQSGLVCLGFISPIMSCPSACPLVRLISALWTGSSPSCNTFFAIVAWCGIIQFCPSRGCLYNSLLTLNIYIPASKCNLSSLQVPLLHNHDITQKIIHQQKNLSLKIKILYRSVR